jgi:hypothetical protein
MKTKFRNSLNKVSLVILFLAIVIFFVHFLYSSNLKKLQRGFHQDYAKFVLTLIDERVHAFGDIEGSVPGDIIVSVSNYFDTDAATRVLVFENSSGTIIYPSSITENYVSSEVLDASGEGMEGEVEFDDRFGYYVRYSKLGVTIMIYSLNSELYFARNQLIYLIIGFFVLFGLILLIFDNRVWGRLYKLLNEMKGQFENAFFLKDKLLKKVDVRKGAGFDEFIQSYNKMATRADEIFKRLQSKIGTLVQNNDNMKKTLIIYKKHLGNETLVKLNEKNITDMESKRHNVSSLSIELVNFLDPVNKLYPQVVTQELTHLHSFVKNEVAKHGGTINFSHGYFLNIVYGVPTPVENTYSRAINGYKRVLKWVNERNSSSKNISGVKWDIKAGLSSGSALAGIVGDSFIVLGDVVEESIDMLDYAKYYGVSLVTDSLEKIKKIKDLKYRKLDMVETDRGKTENKRAIYEIFLKTPDMLEDAVKLYYHGLDMFFDGKYDMAVYEFKKVNDMFNGDNPSHIFLERCEKMIKS